MVREAAAFEIGSLPEVLRLVEEVVRSGRPYVLKHGGADVAVLAPARPMRQRRGKAVTQADIDAALSASWVGLVDAEQLKRETRAARGDHRAAVVRSARVP